MTSIRELALPKPRAKSGPKAGNLEPKTVAIPP
jgi:hypothetical protein